MSRATRVIGDDWTFAVAFSLAASAADLTGYTVSGRLVRNGTEVASASTFSATPSAGTASLSISNTVTSSLAPGRYCLHVSLTSPSGRAHTAGEIDVEAVAT